MVEESMRVPLTPRLLKDQSPARGGRSPELSRPVTSRMACWVKASSSGVHETSLKTVAHRHPGESQLTWATAFSARSTPKWSAYQVEPAYRPWEWPGHQAMRTERRRAAR